MHEQLRPSGLSAVGSLPWGAHFCQFYGDQADLVDSLVPFFKAGLDSNEKCLWVTSEPLPARDARTALRNAVPDLAEHDRTWSHADEVSAWVAGHVLGMRSGESDAAVGRVRGTWGIGWRQAWTGREGQLVLYARDAGRDARIALRLARPVRITVLVPAGQVDERRIAPGDAPTMVDVPAGPHAMVTIHNDEGRP